RESPSTQVRGSHQRPRRRSCGLPSPLAPRSPPAERLQMSRAAAGAAAVLCFGGATALHAVQDRWPKPSIDRPELLYVRSPAAARRAFIGSQAMAADLYWIRAIQHFGQERLSPPTHARTY